MSRQRSLTKNIFLLGICSRSAVCKFVVDLYSKNFIGIFGIQMDDLLVRHLWIIDLYSSIIICFWQITIYTCDLWFCSTLFCKWLRVLWMTIPVSAYISLSYISPSFISPSQVCIDKKIKFCIHFWHILLSPIIKSQQNTTSYTFFESVRITSLIHRF